MYAAEHAQGHGDQPAIVMAGSGEVVTYAQFEAAANQVAQFLRESGLRRGDHVAVFMENEPRMLIFEGGAERTGVLYTLVNSYLSTEEAAYIINDAEARVVVASSSKAGVVGTLPQRCPMVERWVMAERNLTPPDPFEAWSQSIGGMSERAIPDEQRGAPMHYSSGTTGRPKGILRPFPAAHPAEPPPGMEGIVALWRLRPDMTYLSPAPLYHTAPQVSVNFAIRLGATAVVMERFDATAFLELVARHRVTHTQVVPTMFSRLLKLPEQVRRGADLSSLEVVVHAAAPCPVPVKEQIIEWFGPILLEYYAATEGNGCTFCDSHDWLAHPGTVGRAVLGEVEILDDEGARCPPGVPGTIWFRGATRFEYFNDPEKTASSRRDGGETSTVGDIGYLDQDRFLYLTDRKSHMIISGGVNIYPQEVEDLLISHPRVLDAAVIGVPDDDLGEAVKAVVQTTAEATPGPDLERDLLAFCRDHLAHFKCPRTVDFTDELPRLPTGKLYKMALRERYWAEHATRIV